MRLQREIERRGMGDCDEEIKGAPYLLLASLTSRASFLSSQGRVLVSMPLVHVGCGTMRSRLYMPARACQDSPPDRLAVHAPACSPSRRRPASTLPPPPSRPSTSSAPPTPLSCTHQLPRKLAVDAAEAVAEVLARHNDKVAVDGALEEAGAAGLDHSRDEQVDALPCRTMEGGEGGVTLPPYHANGSTARAPSKGLPFHFRKEWTIDSRARKIGELD